MAIWRMMRTGDVQTKFGHLGALSCSSVWFSLRCYHQSCVVGLWIPFPDTVGKTLSFTCLGYQNINAQVDSPELSRELVPRGHGNRSQSIGCCWGPTGEVSGKVDVPMKSWEFLAKNWDVPPKNGFLFQAWRLGMLIWSSVWSQPFCPKMI